MSRFVKDMTKEELESRYRGRSALVTGSNGFVASYLIPRLKEFGVSVHGLDVHESQGAEGYAYHRCDLTKVEQATECVAGCRPDFVFHLASQSSVGTSWQHEWETIECNVRSVHNLFRAVGATGGNTSVLLVSSGEVYGNRGGKKASETSPLQPMNPYAVSKAMMEMVAHRFRDNHLKFVIIRAYNHTGPGRPDTFFEAGVARRFAEAAKAKRDSCLLRVGNIENVRDYSDVRDVVDKYLLLLCCASHGDVYNVCSGTGIRLGEIISIFESITKIRALIEVDEERLRKNDIPYLVGVNRVRKTGRPLVETLTDLYKSFL